MHRIGSIKMINFHRQSTTSEKETKKSVMKRRLCFMCLWSAAVILLNQSSKHNKTLKGQIFKRKKDDVIAQNTFVFV